MADASTVTFVAGLTVGVLLCVAAVIAVLWATTARPAKRRDPPAAALLAAGMGAAAVQPVAVDGRGGDDSDDALHVALQGQVRLEAVYRYGPRRRARARPRRPVARALFGRPSEGRASDASDDDANASDDSDDDSAARPAAAARDDASRARLPKNPWIVLKDQFLYIHAMEEEEENDDNAETGGGDNGSGSTRARTSRGAAPRELIVQIDGASVDLVPRELLPAEHWMTAFPIRIWRDIPLLPDVHHLYLFASTSSQKEDWYFVLRKASRCGGEVAQQRLRRTQLAHRRWAEKLLQDMHAARMDPALGAVNAVLSRLIWNMDADGSLSASLRTKVDSSIQRALARDGKPTYLRNIAVRSLTTGKTWPLITSSSPPLIDGQGNLTASAMIAYTGGFKVVVAAEVGLGLGLPLMRGLSLPIELSVEIVRLVGKLQVLMKQPPTDRIWLGFIERPKLELAVVPLVGDTTISFTLVCQYIENLVADAVYSSLVLPNMVDIQYPTLGESRPADIVPGGETSDELADLLHDDQVRSLQRRLSEARRAGMPTAEPSGAGKTATRTASGPSRLSLSSLSSSSSASLSARAVSSASTSASSTSFPTMSSSSSASLARLNKLASDKFNNAGVRFKAARDAASTAASSFMRRQQRSAAAPPPREHSATAATAVPSAPAVVAVPEPEPVTMITRPVGPGMPGALNEDAWYPPTLSVTSPSRLRLGATTRLTPPSLQTSAGRSFQPHAVD